MLRSPGILGSVSVALGLFAMPDVAVAQDPETEPTDAGVVPEPGDAGSDPATEPAPEPEPEPEPEPSMEFSADAGTSSAPPPAAAASSPAEPEDGGIRPFRHRFGIGVIRTIAGLNGVNFRFFITDKFAVGANVGVAMFTFREDDPDSTDVCPGPDCEFEDMRTVAAIAGSLEALYFAKLGRTGGRLPFRADFGLGGRFGAMGIVNAQDIPEVQDDPVELHVELPLIIQLMFGENFALAPEFGVDFRIVPGNRADPGDPNPGTGQPSQISPGDPGAVNGPGFGFEITPGIGLFGGASMHYYF